jgi:Leucine Rich Repeat (LRR) protein
MCFCRWPAPILSFMWVLWLSLVVLATAGCDISSGQPSSFTLEFPAAESLGTLRIVEDMNCFTCGTSEKDLGPAAGRIEVRLPASHWYVSLEMPHSASRLMPYLAHPSLTNLGDLNLQGSDITDEDLQYLSGIHLRSINLSDTEISGAGLKYLHPHWKWTWVELLNCARLDAQFLAHFRGWDRSTIRLTPYKWSGDRYSADELRLLESAKRIICADQPENVCGTQIR